MNKIPMCPNIVIVTEGNTEIIYLQKLKERGVGYSVHTHVSPQKKPIKIVKYCKTIFKRNKMSIKRGDKAFCVLDIDNNSDSDMKEAYEYAKANNIELIVSNPCIEVFFLMHFIDFPNLPKSMTPKETKHLLGEYIEGYNETMDCWKYLYPAKDDAIERSRNFIVDKDEFRSDGLIYGSNIYELFDCLSKMKSFSESDK